MVTMLEHSKAKCNDICDLVKLQGYLEAKGLSTALSVTADGVKSNSWVGVIKYKNTQFQILPKLLKGIDETNIKEKSEQILKNLVFMLSYTRKMDIKTSDSANLSNCKNPFLEILIREFAQSLFDCLKRLTPKNYVREEDNLNFLRGKLKFNENIRFNATNQAKFYCEFDEYSENNILNQLFLYVATCLYAISSSSNNKRLLKFIMDYYCDIALVKLDKTKVNKIILNRNQKLFEKPFKLAKMFLEHSSVDLSKNKFENITLLWDMNKLFEEFIYEVIRRQLGDLYKVHAQKGHRLMRHIRSNLTYGDTAVDVYLEDNNKEKIILDTKYKLSDGNRNDFSNADVYQVTTYCLLHGAHQAILLYPNLGNTTAQDNYISVCPTLNEIENLSPDNPKKIKLRLACINMDYENLSKAVSDEFKEDIAKILKGEADEVN